MLEFTIVAAIFFALALYATMRDTHWQGVLEELREMRRQMIEDSYRQRE